MRKIVVFRAARRMLVVFQQDLACFWDLSAQLLLLGP